MAKPKEEKDIGITAKKETDMAEWYQQVCLKAELADYAPVKGCMIIRPNGYAIWQSIQDYFNENINKPTKVRNAYFPLFIPESFFHKEAEHAEGFTPEVAWLDKAVTGEGERLAVRPTSETIMYASYANWIRSYKDLPLKINQWCNVVRWETQATKLFLRSREFLWQEGHCVYEAEDECFEDTYNYIKLYKHLCEDLLAMPVILGRKTDKEKFAGAIASFSIEGFMPDGKALQCGTAHLLGQGFAKAFGISYLGKDEKEHLPWQNSWGLSTRLIGGLVMTHSDQKGLVLPPKVAPVQIVIVPIIFESSKEIVLMKCIDIKKQLEKHYRVELDDREDYSSGWKFNEWEMKGVPIRIEIGPKDIEAKKLVLARRDNGEKKKIEENQVLFEVKEAVDNMQKDLYSKAKNFLDSNIIEAKSWDEFVHIITNRQVARCKFCGEPECENWIKDKSGGASSRSIVLDKKGHPVPVQGKCVHCGKDAKYETYFSKSY